MFKKNIAHVEGNMLEERIYLRSDVIGRLSITSGAYKEYSIFKTSFFCSADICAVVLQVDPGDEKSLFVEKSLSAQRRSNTLKKKKKNVDSLQTSFSTIPCSIALVTPRRS